MDFSYIVVKWIWLNWYMDLKKFLFCQNCLINKKKAEVRPRLESLLKLLLWTKRVEWLKVLYILGPLCLWQCFLQCCAVCDQGINSCLVLARWDVLDLDCKEIFDLWFSIQSTKKGICGQPKSISISYQLQYLFIT